MPSRASYSDKTRELRYRLDGDPQNDIVCHFYRGRITPNWIREFNEASSAIQNAQTAAEFDTALLQQYRMFCEVTASWNITETDDPGSPVIPLKVEDVATLGISLIGGLIHAYIEAVQDPEVVESVESKPLPTLLPSARKGSMAS